MITDALICPHCLAEGELTSARAFEQHKRIHTVCQIHGTHPYIGSLESLTVGDASKANAHELKKQLRLAFWFNFMKLAQKAKDIYKKVS